MGKIITTYKEYDCRIRDIVEGINIVSDQISSNPSAFGVLIRLLKNIQDLYDDKLHCAYKINELIRSKLQEVDSNQEVRQFKDCSVTPDKTLPEPSGSSTPIEKGAPPAKKRRGRKPMKLMNEHKQDFSHNPMKTESRDLMLLADVAINKEGKEDDPGLAGSLAKVPVTKRVRNRRRGRNRKNKEVQSSEGDQTVDGDDEEEVKEADENEPLYCLCNKPSFGSMIECDNEACAIEWFHFACVQLKKTPKGKW